MNTYIIGDIHGHLDELELLLAKINFTTNDQLWLTGDLINGGPKSLETIRLIKSLTNQVTCVLGNHDIILLALAYNKPLLNIFINRNSKNPKAINGILQILAAKDLIDLINWLEYRPLTYFNKTFNLLLVHAGVHPDWTINKTLSLSQEVAVILQSSNKLQLYENIYGDHPDNWNDNLSSWDRIRCIINYLTRIRFCSNNGKINLLAKGNPNNPPAETAPWYTIESRKTKEITIVFGHWSALEGEVKYPNIIPLDTGCRWGGKLTAYKVETKEFFSVPAMT